jgi:hypothetical protein
MRNKKNSPSTEDQYLLKLLEARIQIEKQKKELEELKKLAASKEKSGRYFKPLPGAHANNCGVCNQQSTCDFANDNFTFCPKQKTVKKLNPLATITKEVMGRLFTLRIN